MPLTTALVPRAAAVLLLVLLAGCGGDAGTVDPGGPTVTPTPTPTGTTSAADTDLTIRVDDGSGGVQEWTLTCDPPGGTHPDPEAACAALAGASREALRPPPPDLVCTQQYGGPQTATVTGVVDGAQVQAQLSRTDGCEISRWDALLPVLVVEGGVTD